MKAKSLLITLGLVIVCSVQQGYSQGTLSKLKNGLKGAADKAVDNGLEKLNNQGKMKQTPASDVPPSAPESQPASTKVKDDFGIFSKYTFTPGEKIIYEENFNNAVTGELPEGWNSNSSGHIVIGGDKSKWLNAINGIYLSGVNTEKFGEEYTIEFDIILNVTPQTGYYLPYFDFGGFAGGEDIANHNKFLSGYRMNNAFEIRIEPSALKSKITMRSFAANGETFKSGRLENEIFKEKLKEKIHVAVMVQKSRLQLWVDEHKMLDIPKGVNNYAAPINQVFFKTENSGGYNENNFSYLVSNIKIASGLGNIQSSLIQNGTFSTTSIIFDVNSDRLKPQSGGMIRKIADALGENPQVRIRITGHTDSDGQAQANKELSLKRAAALKNILVKRFEIDPSRIETEGKGAAEPVATNNTSEGKAANRRVEFSII